MSAPQQAHLQLLQLITRNPALSQREMARELGISLGKTHYLLRALLEKGLVKVDNFRCSRNKLNYLYLLTPAGIEAKRHITRDYLRRKEAEYLALQAEIETLQRELEAADSLAPLSDSV